jgi:hypothetical protein
MHEAKTGESRVNREFVIVLVWLTVVYSMVVIAYKVGHYEGQIDGSTYAQMHALQEVKRQCDSKLPLRLDNLTYTCYKAGEL